MWLVYSIDLFNGKVELRCSTVLFVYSLLKLCLVSEAAFLSYFELVEYSACYTASSIGILALSLYIIFKLL